MIKPVINIFFFPSLSEIFLQDTKQKHKRGCKIHIRLLQVIAEFDISRDLSIKKTSLLFTSANNVSSNIICLNVPGDSLKKRIKFFLSFLFFTITLSLTVNVKETAIREGINAIKKISCNYQDKYLTTGERVKDLLPLQAYPFLGENQKQPRCFSRIACQ